MKGKSFLGCVLGWVLFLFAAEAAWAEVVQEQKEPTKVEKDTKKPKRPPIVFKRPTQRRGSPVRTVGGGSRGAGDDLPSLSVLSPVEVGLTTQEQPSLFWHLAGPTDSGFLFTLAVHEDIPETILEVKLKSLDEHGISRMDLSALKIRLKPGIRYIWTVALVVDPDSPSTNVVSTTVIRRERPPESMLERLTVISGSDPGEVPILESADSQKWLDVDRGLELARIYADGGFFLDALSVLSYLVEAHPADTELQELREEMLQQVELGLDNR